MVIVVAIAVVLVVLIITVSMRGRQKRAVTRRADNRQELAEANERAARGTDRDTAEEQARRLTIEIVSLPHVCEPSPKLD